MIGLLISDYYLLKIFFVWYFFRNRRERIKDFLEKTQPIKKNRESI
jgi:hypothetical protein